MEKKKVHNFAIDALRAIAILAVVGVHTTTRVLEASSFNILGFSFTLFINQALRFAVPLFFMISGFVLELNFRFHQNYLSYLKKRFSKIFLPYLFWSAIYYFFIYTTHTINFGNTLLYGAASYQLYFIPTLLIFYIIFPLIHKLYKIIANKWVMIALGIIQIYLLYRTYYVTPLPIFYPLAIACLNYYAFILGMVSSHHQDFLQKLTKWIIPTGILSIALAIAVFIQGRSLYLKTNNYLYFYSQWRPSVLAYTIALAAFLYILYNKLNLNPRIIKHFSRLSFFVFFIHVIILEQFWNFIGKKIIGGEIFFNILFFVAVAGISYAIAYLVHKIPLVSKLTG